MSYISLYRKYRPKSFNDVIGQAHIVRTLRNQIIFDSVSHAYLFTGTRGTGKTSCAKIFAKAINCAQPIDGSPCGECEACKAIASDTNFEVMEIDAASNNGVDEIRDLQNIVKYQPNVLKKRVFIIDEVHMLSASAFNALLKTLEEPPAHAVFILATTEVHKLPATILSRCMRFDFRLVSNADLEKRLQYIFNDIGRKAEAEAISAIAEAGDGSVRDALSIADTCLSYTRDVITQNDVLEILGASSPVFTAQICAAILAGEAANALELITKLADNGKNISLLAADLAKALRNVLFCKLCNDAKNILKISDEVFSIFDAAAKQNSLAKINYALDCLCGVEQRQKFSSLPRIVLEAAVVKACCNPLADDSEVMARLRELERKVASGGVAAPAHKAVSYDAVKVLGYLVGKLREQKKIGLYSAVVADANKSEYKEGTFYITAGRKSDYNVMNEKDNFNLICDLLSGEFGIGKVVINLSEQSNNDTAAEVGKISSMFDNTIVTIKK